MNYGRRIGDLPRASINADLVTLIASCSDDLNRLARQPVMIRLDAVNCDDVTPEIELDFGMEQASLNDIHSHEWLRTGQDPQGCTQLVQQLKTLFATPSAASIQIATAQRPA